MLSTESLILTGIVRLVLMAKVFDHRRDGQNGGQIPPLRGAFPPPPVLISCLCVEISHASRAQGWAVLKRSHKGDATHYAAGSRRASMFEFHDHPLGISS